MQVTINIPENLSETVIKQQIAEFEEKLRKQAKLITPITNKKQKYQAIMNISKKCASLPTLDHRSADDVLGYEQSEMGLWGDE